MPNVINQQASGNSHVQRVDHIEWIFSDVFLAQLRWDHHSVIGKLVDGAGDAFALGTQNENYVVFLLQSKVINRCDMRGLIGFP